MQGVINALLNTIFVSIPEESFIVIMTLILLKRFDILDIRMWRYNFKWIMIPTLPMAIMINVFRYIIPIQKPFISLIGYLLMNFLMIYIVIKNSYKINKFEILRTILFTFISFVIVCLAESIYIPAILFSINKPIAFFNNNILYNFLLALPGRITEYAICSYILVKKNDNIKVNLFDTIVKNQFLYSSFLILIVFSNLFIVYFIKLICFDYILKNIGLIEQLMIITISISLPIISITWFLLIVNFILTKQKQIQQTYENLVLQDDIMD